MGGKSSPPPAPDYRGAALAEAQASRENLNTQNYANRPTINTPFGSQSWQTQATIDPATGQQVTAWTQNTTLTPEAQAALNAQLSLQQGRSELAGSFMDRVGQEYSRPFDYSNLPDRYTPTAPVRLDTGTGSRANSLAASIDPNTAALQGAFSFGNVQSSIDPMLSGLNSSVTPTSVVGSVNSRSDAIRSGMPDAGAVSGNVQNTTLQGGVDPMLGQLSRSGQNVDVQRSLMVGDNPALPSFDSSFRDQVANQLMERMQPQFDRQQGSLETQLANQGFERGSEAYKRALDDLQERQSRERFNALDMAGSEAQRLFGMQMGARQQAFAEDQGAGAFANNAAGQAFGQGMALNQFQNQAANQAFNQALAAGNFGNNAAQAQFGQNLAAQQFANQAQNQRYNQLMGATDLANRAAAQAYQQDLGAAQFGNQASAQQFGQNLQAANFGNQTTQQAYQQNLGAAQFGNQAMAQDYAQRMGLANLNNQTAQQAFNQNLAAANFGNQAVTQGQNLDLTAMQARNNALQTQQNMDAAYANQMNLLRQQAIAEEAQRRGMSLNEMNALLTGQQVSMPQMPSFTNAGISQTPQLMQAAQNQYSAAIDAYNAQQQQQANMMGGLTSLASTAMMFSDKRLKRRIKRVGTHAIGVGIYEYEMFGYPQRGVLAQEVQAVRPDLVAKHPSGFLMVNYGGL